MIENERQYRVAKEQAAKLEAGLTRLLDGQSERKIADPLLEETAHAGVQTILTRLRREMPEYESRTAGADRGIDPAIARRPRR